MQAGGVEYCDTAGIGLLFEIEFLGRQNGFTVEIRDLNERFGKLLDMFDPGKFVELLGIDRLIDCHPLELSQAEKKRLGLALACGERRRLLILDEPTQYQDSEGFKKMIEAVHVHAEGGRALLIIAHDPRVEKAFPGAGIIRLSPAGNS